MRINDLALLVTLSARARDCIFSSSFQSLRKDNEQDEAALIVFNAANRFGLHQFASPSTSPRQQSDFGIENRASLRSVLSWSLVTSSLSYHDLKIDKE